MRSLFFDRKWRTLTPFLRATLWTETCAPDASGLTIECGGRNRLEQEISPTPSDQGGMRLLMPQLKTVDLSLVNGATKLRYS
jgi:hypothetical protein